MTQHANAADPPLTRRAFLATCTAILLAGCSHPVPDDGSETAADSDGEEEAAPRPRPAGTVTLGFVGDVCLADNYIPMQHLAELGSTDITDGIDPRFVREMLGVDLMWANNEFAYGTDVEPLAGKDWFAGISFMGTSSGLTGARAPGHRSGRPCRRASTTASSPPGTAPSAAA